MSLLVFSNGTLYGDQRYVVNEGTGTQATSHKRKLHFNTGMTAVVALVGQEPGFNTKDFQLIIDCVCVRVFAAEAGEECAALDEKLIKRMFASGETSYLVMTKQSVLLVTSEHNLRLPEDEDFAIGTGDVCFTVARHAGLSVRNAYVLAAQIVPTMGGDIDQVSRKDLFDVRVVQSTAAPSKPQRQSRKTK